MEGIAKMVNPDHMELRLKQRRNELGLTLEAVGELIGASAQQVWKLEKGERRLTPKWLAKLSRAYDMEPADLLGMSATEFSAWLWDLSSSEAIGEFVEDRAEIQLLRLWRTLDKPQRVMITKMIESIAPKSAEAAA